jgi:hypothetical protein
VSRDDAMLAVPAAQRVGRDEHGESFAGGPEPLLDAEREPFFWSEPNAGDLTAHHVEFLAQHEKFEVLGSR